MSFATYEDFLAEISIITPEPALCIECEIHEPESGADHCQKCLDELNEQTWDRLYDTGYPVSERHRLQDEMQLTSLK